VVVVVGVQRKPVRSPALAPVRSRRASGPLPAAAGRRPRRRGTDEDPTPEKRRFGPPPGDAPAEGHLSPVRGRQFAGDSAGSLLCVFLAATLVMVAAVIVVGIADRWWVLVPVMLVDFAITFGLMSYVVRLLGDDGEARSRAQ
jgi:hypothetical protein